MRSLGSGTVRRREPKAKVLRLKRSRTGLMRSSSSRAAARRDLPEEVGTDMLREVSTRTASSGRTLRE